MARWNDESRWVTEDGVRCYVAESDSSGPSRLECYRRILAKPAAAKPRGHLARLPLTPLASRFTDLVDLAKGGWRRYPAAIATVFHIVGQ